MNQNVNQIKQKFILISLSYIKNIFGVDKRIRIMIQVIFDDGFRSNLEEFRSISAGFKSFPANFKFDQSDSRLVQSISGQVRSD
jgi:hypothetical protein